MELQNKLRFFALFSFNYRRVTLFTPVTPIFFVFFFFFFLGGVYICSIKRKKDPALSCEARGPRSLIYSSRNILTMILLVFLTCSNVIAKYFNYDSVGFLDMFECHCVSGFGSSC